VSLNPDFSLVEPWNIVELIERPLPKVPCWIEPAVLPCGGKLLFGGHAKSGKSFIMLELARSLALGVAPFNCPHLSTPHPVKVAILEQEIGPWGIQKRAKTILAGESRELLQANFHGVSQVRGLKLDTPGTVDFISDFCHKVGAQVLFLDPIGKMHGYDENDAAQISRLFSKIEEIIMNCKDLNLSIVMSHHFGKPLRDPRVELSDDQMFSPYNFRGSSKWYDDPDTLVTCNRLPPDRELGHKWWYVKSKWETRQGEGPPEYLTFSVNRDANLRVVYEAEAMKASSKIYKAPVTKIVAPLNKPFTPFRVG
jgi:hypothetical protein